MRNTTKLIILILFLTCASVAIGTQRGRSAPAPGPRHLTPAASAPAPARVPAEAADPQAPEPLIYAPTNVATWLVYPDGSTERIPFDLPIERGAELWYSGRVTKSWRIKSISYQVFETYTARNIHVEEPTVRQAVSLSIPCEGVNDGK